MEFFVVKEGREYFRTSYSDSEEHAKKMTLSDEPFILNSVTDFDELLVEDGNGGSSEGNSFRSDLKDILCNYNSIGQENPPLKRIHLNVYVSMKSSKTAQVKIFTRSLDSMNTSEATREVPIFDRLVNSTLQHTSITFNLNLKIFLDDRNEANRFEFKAKDLKIGKYDGISWNYGLTTDLEITDQIWQKWHTEASFEGEVTLSVSLDHTAVQQLFLQRLKKPDLSEWPSKMLTHGFLSDMIILAGGETDTANGIKCHKFVLSGRSPVFKTMFTTDMSESRDNILKIPDVTENGIRAMLKFIYCWDLEQATENSELALQLLQAAHKYQIQDLENSMIDLFCAMPFKWVSVNSAVKLLLFSKNAELKRCEERSLQILKRYAQNSGSLVKSEEYQKLFTQSPWLAMELSELFFKI